MERFRLTTTRSLCFLVCCLLATGVAAERQKSVGGMVVNIGVVPASKAFQFEAERSIHGKTPPSGAQHLTVSLSDAKTGAHIATADVSAEIKDPKGKIQKKNLLSASTAGAPDYSEVFSFGWSGTYKIRLTIAPKGSKKPLKTTFTWIHAIE
jgi:hypothetical protein